MTELEIGLASSMCLDGSESEEAHWESLYLDARLRAGNHIIELSWQERKTLWNRNDIARVFVDVVHELVDVPIDEIPINEVKELLRQVHLGAWDVLPPEFRDF